VKLSNWTSVTGLLNYKYLLAVNLQHILISIKNNVLKWRQNSA